MRENPEAQLGRSVVAWLRDQYWDVYQEVQVRGYGPVADIVAVQNRIVWVIELKMTLGLDVIGQAFHWIHRANYVSVGVPPRRNQDFGQTVARHLGIGVLLARTDNSVSEVIEPKLHRLRSSDTILSNLHEEQKTWGAAGNAISDRFTPFRKTCRNIAAAVAARPGITIKELMGSVETHYSSISTARSCIAKWAAAGLIPGIRAERDGRCIRLFLCQNPKSPSTS